MHTFRTADSHPRRQVLRQSRLASRITWRRSDERLPSSRSVRGGKRAPRNISIPFRGGPDAPRAGDWAGVGCAEFCRSSRATIGEPEARTAREPGCARALPVTRCQPSSASPRCPDEVGHPAPACVRDHRRTRWLVRLARAARWTRQHRSRRARRRRAGAVCPPAAGSFNRNGAGKRAAAACSEAGARRHSGWCGRTGRAVDRGGCGPRQSRTRGYACWAVADRMWSPINLVGRLPR